MNTRKTIARALLSVVVTGFAGGALAQVVGSQHDLTTGGSAQGSTSNTDEVCVFCHTPHGADTNAPVPLWNKVLPNPTTFDAGRYSTLNLVTFDSIEAPVGSVSLACLSCHDGAQAMDVVLNLPGSGGYNAGGQEVDPIAIGTMAGTPVPNLGTDLSNDHPISMQYGGGGALATDPDGLLDPSNLGDPDFKGPVKDTINNSPVWWVDSPPGTALTREKGDMLLYTRADLGTLQPFVECGSCHDPHNSATQAPGSVAFLRIDNTASQICTTCHNK